MLSHLEKYALWYILGAIALGLLIYFNWDTIKGWFTTTPAGTTAARISLAQHIVCDPDCSGNKQCVLFRSGRTGCI